MAENKSVRTSSVRKKAVKAGFRSGLEQSVSLALIKAKIKHEYEPKDFTLEYTTKVRNAHCTNCGCSYVEQKHTYLPDFTLKNRSIILEVKGIFDNKDRNKIKNLAETHKKITFVVLLQNPNKKITKLVTYSKWCDKNNILWLSYKDDWVTLLKKIIND